MALPHGAIGWNVRSMVFYLITELQTLSCLASFGRAIFLLCKGINFMRILICRHENSIVNTCTGCILKKKQNYSGKDKFYLLKKCAEH